MKVYWKNDKREGKGSMNYINNEKYEGYWKMIKGKEKEV